MNPYCFRSSITLLFLALGGCSSDADTDAEDVTASAVIEQITPSRGQFDDVIVAYGQGGAGSGGARAITLPLDVTLMEVDVMAGQRVRAGQRLAVFTPSKAAAAARTAARSAVSLAREQRDRLARLRTDHLATNEQWLQADKALRDAEATLAAQATVDDTVRAAADGTVLSVDARRGAMVTAGAPLLTFADDTLGDFAGGVEPGDMDRVHVGETVALKPLSGGGTLAARIIAVAGAVDPTTHLVNVRARAATPVVQGAAYRGDIVVGTLEGWRVPADAVIGEDDSRAVWEVVKGKAHRVPVTVVAQHGAEALVDGKIDPSRPLVTVGAPQLDEGMQVRPAAMK
ncbi:efflux RND transporter periplasmic adaptor subunit [Luteibacter sp.]|jgi:RND family efflux transporter MFP subunit|uniref:efflux RND transporter periplasmic adaptor subunit n=1 Tax=Luteibacter sp. TaxID=1886636 RepID=UPI002F4147AC